MTYRITALQKGLEPRAWLYMRLDSFGCEEFPLNPGAVDTVDISGLVS